MKTVDVCSEGILIVYYVAMIFNSLSTYRNITVSKVEEVYKCSYYTLVKTLKNLIDEHSSDTQFSVLFSFLIIVH